ncbi:MAG: hypothetical protein WC460_04890 [Patescibacteria group bacterium]
MRRIYKFCLIASALILTILIGNFVLAAGQGYFLEKGNEVYIYDNLQVNGYLAAAKDNSKISGISGDILIGADFNADINSNIYFCKSVNVTNDCPQKAMIWHGGPDFSLEAIDPNFYKIQTNKILGINSDLNLSAADGSEISSSSPIKVTGCLAADGSADCNQGEVKTSIMYVDSLNSLNKFCAGGTNSGKTCIQHLDCPNSVCLSIIKLNPSTLVFEDLNLGEIGTARLNNITLPDETGEQKTTAPQINLQNVCYVASSLSSDCLSPANGAVVAPSTFLAQNPSWNFTSTLYPAGFQGDNNKKICCNLSIIYPVAPAQ